MASFIARLALAAGVELPASPPDAFRDDDGNEHERAINALAAIGIVQGRQDGSYGPNEPVLRDQMASYIARLHAKATGQTPTSSRDWRSDDSGDVHEADINAVSELGVSRGTSDTDGDGTAEFDPSSNLTRAQMASFIARELGVLVEGGYAHQGGVGIELTNAEAPPGGEFAGTALTNGRIESITVSGCGHDAEPVSVGPQGGDFTVGAPTDRGTGPCSLSFAITSSRDQLDEDARPIQRVTHTFSVLVS
jgi:hypothetical protein